MHRPASTLAALLVAALLSGCASSGSSTTSPGASSGPTTSGGVDETGTPVVTGFDWVIGRSWDHRFTIGNGTDAFGFDYRATAVALVDGGWSVQSSTVEAAVANAAFFLGSLGSMSDGGTLTHDGYAFPFYSFPLTANKTWTATETNLSGQSFAPEDHELTMTATWQPPVGAGAGRYLIEAREGDHVRARYDFDLALQWFSSFELYSGMETFRVVAKDAPNTRGTAYDATATVLLAANGFAAGAPANPVTPTATTFQMDASMTHLAFIQFAYGAPGAAATRILAPDGTQYGTTSIYDPNGQGLLEDFAQSQNIVPAQAGLWVVTAGGAGVFVTHYVVYCAGITVSTFAGTIAAT